jgi:FlaA1/EpsC-like NDP-sugar epimerase
MESNWEGFLGRVPVGSDEALARAAVWGKRVLITGAGGSIGSAIACAILGGQPEAVVLLDCSEQALYAINRRIAGLTVPTSVQVIPVVGSVADRSLLDFLFRQYRPDLVVHAAAYKHVPLMELNPFSAMANNAVATYTLVTAALQYGIQQLLLVSTDKAVHPTNIMGASKRVAELVVLSHAHSGVLMNVIRLGNVLGSSGSVVPLFKEQLSRGIPLTITHAEASRYFLTASEAEAAILRAAKCDHSGRILMADCGAPLLILDLVRHLSKVFAGPRSDETADQPALQIIGLRPGEKLHEDIVSTVEEREGRSLPGLRIVSSPTPSAHEVAAGMERIATSIRNFDLSEMISATLSLVPDYQPSSALQAEATTVGAR